MLVWRELKAAVHFSFAFCLFFFFIQPQNLTKSSVNNAFVHCSWTHKFHFSVTFSLKIGLTILFTHLKIILLQCFQFQFFSFSNNKFNPNRPIDRWPSKLNDKLTLVHKYKQWSDFFYCSFLVIFASFFGYCLFRQGL